MAYALGLDYGTNSVRALIVNCKTGTEVGTAVFNYPSGKQGVIVDPDDPHLARQHPGDYLAGLQQTVLSTVSAAQANDSKFSPTDIIAIGVDTTGSSPIPVDANNVPLAMDPQWKSNPAAQCWLWKDHTSWREAAKITEIAAAHRPQYIAKCGNTYSSEWFWSKIWHCLATAPDVFHAADSWVEFCDWIPSVLAGATKPGEVKRGVCAAGHKALYCEEWNGLPDKEFLAMLDPALADLRDRLYEKAHDAATPAGQLCPEWAAKLGLPKGIPIAIGAFDVHFGAVGSLIEEGVLVKAIGTSTCDCIVVDGKKHTADIPGICGIVKGSILPGYLGIEAGQSAVGDIFRWWVEEVLEGDAALHGALTSEATALSPGRSGLLALDWNNGNRTILVNPLLTGLLLGQTLHTSRAEIYRALIEATAFGARMIIERIREYGVPIERVVCCGGIAEKNALLMQIYADVTGCALQVSGSSQACALGSAIVASALVPPDKGGHASIRDAQQAMATLKEISYVPDPANARIYDQLFALYKQVHDAFGGVNRSADLSAVMQTLLEIKSQNSASETV